MSGRVFFVAMDSGDSVLLDRWMDEGVLPNLARLRAEAAVAIVRSPPELGNGEMWLTLATGVNMARHGIHYIRQLQPGDYRLFNVDEDVVCKVPTLWQRISDAGKRCVIVDVFRSPLSGHLLGLQINDWLTHFRTLAPRSTPPEAIHEISHRFGSDPFDGNADKWVLTHRDYRRLVDLFVERVEMKTRAIAHLMATQPWDLLMTAYADIHDVSHLCWHLHDPAAPGFDAPLAGEIGDPLKRIYQCTDDAIGRLVATLTPDDTVVFFAGLGFQNMYSVGKLFEDIVERLDSGGVVRRDAQRSALARRIGAVRPSVLRKLLPKRLQHWLGRSMFRMTDTISIDARRNSRFFALPCEGHAGALRINLSGREPEGKVASDQLDAVLDEIERNFLAIVNVETGEPLVAQVIRTRDHYQGPHLDDLPDMFIVWNRRAPIRTVQSPAIGTMQISATSVRSGDHTPLSYLMLKGPGIAPGRIDAPARAEDVAATLMALAGCDFADVDGRPLPVYAL